MKRTLIAALTALLFATGVAHAEEAAADKASADQKATLVALELMNHALGDHQQKVEPRLEMMREYLKENDLVEAFVKSQADVKADPALLTYDDALATAVKHVEENEVAAEAEFDDLGSEQADRDIKALKGLTEPRFEEVQQKRGTVQRIADFLKSQKKLAGYMAWAGEKQDEQKDEEVKSDDQKREKDEAEAKAEHEKFEQTKQHVDEERRADHQAELQRQFELKEQSMKSEAQVQSAKYSGGDDYGPYWYGGWNDPYHDLYR